MVSEAPASEAIRWEPPVGLAWAVQMELALSSKKRALTVPMESAVVAPTAKGSCLLPIVRGSRLLEARGSRLPAQPAASGLFGKVRRPPP